MEQKATIAPGAKTQLWLILCQNPFGCKARSLRRYLSLLWYRCLCLFQWYRTN